MYDPGRLCKGKFSNALKWVIIFLAILKEDIYNGCEGAVEAVI